MNKQLNVTEYELDLIVLALEFFASNGSMGDLESDELRQLANKVAAELAVKP